MSLPHHQTPVKRVLKAKTGAASAPKSAIKKTVNPASRTKIKAAAAANKPDAKKGGQRKLGQAS